MQKLSKPIFTPTSPSMPLYTVNYGPEGGGAGGRTLCWAEYTDARTGITYRYSGWVVNGRCVFYNKSRAGSGANFNGEQAVWKDCTGERYNNADGDACAFKYPDGSISTGVVTNGVCTVPVKGKGWDFANKLLDFASNLISHKGVTGGETNVVVAPPAQSEKSGMSTLGVIGIIAGVGVLGFIIYKIASK